MHKILEYNFKKMNSNSLQVFTNEGKFINKYGGKGQADGKFNSPCGIAADADGAIYVSDFRNHRIHVL